MVISPIKTTRYITSHMFSHANSKKHTCVSRKANGNPNKTRRPKYKHRKNPFTTARIALSAFIHNYTTNSCAQQMNTAKTFQDDLRSSHVKTAEKSQHDTTLLLQLCPYMHFTGITGTCITHSASRLLGDNNQQRYMNILIALRQNKTIVSCAQKQIAQMTLPK